MNLTILESTAYVRTHVLEVMGHILLLCCKERPLVGDKKDLYLSINAIVTCWVCLAPGCPWTSLNEWLVFRSFAFSGVSYM